MNYYIDTEFLEGFHKPIFGRRRHFIDLISVGIVSEDNREYYAINKDFDFKAAWNSFQMKRINVSGDAKNIWKEGYYMVKEYWLRENVLKPIFKELWYDKCHLLNLHHVTNDFTYSNFKKLVSIYGQSIDDIRYGIFSFFFPLAVNEWVGSLDELWTAGKTEKVALYGYYSSYDHVLLCSIFGKMIDLPNGVPMLTYDLKQQLDEKADKYDDRFMNGDESFEWKLGVIKNKANYPKQQNEHNALDDAKFNRDLHKFLQSI
jgi:hypothetical protein